MGADAVEPEDGLDTAERLPEARRSGPVERHRLDRSPVGWVALFNIVVVLGFGSILLSLVAYLRWDDPDGLSQWWIAAAGMAGLQVAWFLGDRYAHVPACRSERIGSPRRSSPTRSATSRETAGVSPRPRS